jgi:hypothetical protein
LSSKESISDQAPGRKRSMWPEETAAERAPEIGLLRRTPSHVEISVCPCSGNPYKRANFHPIPMISGPLSNDLRSDL